MKPILVPAHYNYVAVFLTLDCNLSCSYCINRFERLRYDKAHLTGKDWIRGLNRIVSRPDLPLTLGGGEPSLHPEFTAIINGLRPELNIDLLTNLEFDVDSFMAAVPPSRLKRVAPYASIRVSYHPETMSLVPLVTKVMRLLDKGYSVGVWGVMHPLYGDEVLRAQEKCLKMGIDFRIKEYLGEHAGRLYGAIRYKGACDLSSSRKVLCRTTELIIGPSGAVYRCHSDLYEGRTEIGHILDPDFDVNDIFRNCSLFGHCNPCDVKIKTNRFQQPGHTSVEIVSPEGYQMDTDRETGV